MAQIPISTTLNELFKRPVHARVAAVPATAEIGTRLIETSTGKIKEFTTTSLAVEDVSAIGAFCVLVGYDGTGSGNQKLCRVFEASNLANPYFITGNAMDCKVVKMWGDTLVVLRQDSGTNQDIVLVNTITGDYDKIAAAKVVSIAADDSDRLWIACEDKLLKYTKNLSGLANTPTEYTFAAESLPITDISKMAVSGSKVFVINDSNGTNEGCWMLDGSWTDYTAQFLAAIGKAAMPVDLVVNSMETDNNGNIWMTTTFATQAKSIVKVTSLGAFTAVLTTVISNWATAYNDDLLYTASTDAYKAIRKHDLATGTGSDVIYGGFVGAVFDYISADYGDDTIFITYLENAQTASITLRREVDGTYAEDGKFATKAAAFETDDIIRGFAFNLLGNAYYAVAQNIGKLLQVLTWNS